MDTAVTATVAVAGMIFSLTLALLFEELLFGIVFRLMSYSRRIAAGMHAKQSPAFPIVSRTLRPPRPEFTRIGDLPHNHAD